MTSTSLRIAIIVFFALNTIILGLACKPRRNPNEKRYDLKGKVVAVDKFERTATIAHEDIKGYMPAMTMPFRIRNDADLEMMKAGDQVTGTLVVSDADSWVEITAIVEGPAPASQDVDVPGEPRPGTEIPDFGLVNQDGKRIHLAQYRGQALALTFIYTRCPMPDQCTLMSNNFAAIDQELQKRPGVYAGTHLLTISFDPEYDSPKVLRSYGASHSGRYSDETFQHWEFAGGSADEVKGIAQYFGLRYFHDTESGQDQVIHSLRTVVIGPDGKVFKLYRGNEWKPAEVVADLQSLSQN